MGWRTPKILPLPVGDFDPSLIHGSLDPHEPAPNGISIGSAVFTGLTNVTHRHTETQTDRPRYSVYSNSMYLMRCGRCGLIKIDIPIYILVLVVTLEAIAFAGYTGHRHTVLHTLDINLTACTIMIMS